MDRVIYLIRHGQIDSGNEKRYIGITDLPLSNEGVEQINRLKEFFSDIEIEKAFVSTLKRCIQTSDILIKGRKIERILVNELKEINMGDWENQSIEYIRGHFREQYDIRGVSIDVFTPPGGESFEQLQKRVMPAFEYITNNTKGNILIISHAGVNRVILSKLLDFPLRDIFKIKQPYGCINQLHWDATCRRWQWDQEQTK